MKITIYSTSTCSFCHALKDWLGKEGVTYEERVTDEDDTAMDEFLAINEGVMTVPLTIIEKDDGTTVQLRAFNKGDFKKELNL